MSPTRCLSLAATILVACGLEDPLGGLPTLAGYRPGQTWQEIGRAMPCQAESRSLYWDFNAHPQLRGHIRGCNASDSVVLQFVYDTLHEVSIHWIRHVTRPRDFWLHEVSTPLTHALGEPDSVSLNLDANPRTDLEDSMDRALGIVHEPVERVEVWWGGALFLGGAPCFTTRAVTACDSTMAARSSWDTPEP